MSEIQKQIGEVLLILGEAKCEEIDRKKCFVLKSEKFFRVMDLMGDWVGDAWVDERLSAAGWNNMRLRISNADENVYFVVCKTDPVLDEIWRSKKKD